MLQAFLVDLDSGIEPHLEGPLRDLRIYRQAYEVLAWMHERAVRAAGGVLQYRGDGKLSSCSRWWFPAQIPNEAMVSCRCAQDLRRANPIRRMGQGLGVDDLRCIF